MFYLRYLRSELLRRRARTILTVLGLALGVALLIVTSALTRGLDRAQETALDPLASIGSDLTISRVAQEDVGPGGAGGRGEVFAANRSVLTDLSKLGKPGERFVHDFFLPGTQLTFPQADARAIASLPGVAAVGQGLLLLAQHQEGVVPKIVAEFQTGGERIDVTRRLQPPTAAELVEIQACLEKARAADPQAAPGSGGSGRPDRGAAGPGGFGFGGGVFQHACRNGSAVSGHR